jgi:uncharacterized LabA/DUF88 family protein
LTPARSSSAGSSPASDKPRAVVYIDGFNLYYSIRFTHYRWLDLLALSRHLFPELEIQQVKYFTALVNLNFEDDPGARARQKTYLRALRTLQPELEIHEGSFNRHKAPAALVLPKDSRWRRWLLALALGSRDVLKRRVPKAMIWKVEEKGSDVSLATHLIADAYEGKFDVAAVLSSDMDLEHPLRCVREELGKPVILFNAASYRHKRLAPEGAPGSSYVRIGGKSLSACQFPESMSDARGRFQRPPGWEEPKRL